MGKRGLQDVLNLGRRVGRLDVGGRAKQGQIGSGKGLAGRNRPYCQTVFGSDATGFTGQRGLFQHIML